MLRVSKEHNLLGFQKSQEKKEKKRGAKERGKKVRKDLKRGVVPHPWTDHL
jgi:hypothetical protein|tara:strand:+ start:145 stop:297 length:153 start_codon:yes stop_codon:yes gene_type:complete